MNQSHNIERFSKLHPIATVLVAASVAGMTACANSEERATFPVPASPTSVTVARISMHAFLAEYRRDLIVEGQGRPARRVEMFPDSGGYSRANLYRIDAQRVLLRDVDSSYTIEVATGTVSKDEKRQAAAIFLGSFDVDATGTWRFIFAGERAELPTEFLRGS
jgi:hypothetical protein